MSALHTFDDVVALIRKVSANGGVIAIDGGGGSGKSTFARKLSEFLNHCPIIPTDDFASWENPLNWYPNMIEQALRPLSLGQQARYQRFDWVDRKLADWIMVEPGGFFIIEGVSSARKEFRPFLNYSIFVKTQRETRLQRGIERDGLAAREQWLRWMTEEDAYFKRDDPENYVNLVISGQSGSPKNDVVEILR